MYLLTREEYDELRKKREDVRIRDQTKAQAICTDIANKMPVVTWLNDGKPTPWGCILSTKSEWYCDECPVRDICPCDDKEWSK